MAELSKQTILQKMIEQQEKVLEMLLASAFEAKEASTNEESKAENKYDTRGLEAAYLAAGQVQRARELQEKIYHLKNFTLTDVDPNRIALSALVDLQLDDEETKTVFLLPVGGVELTLGSTKIQSVTLEAPLGQKLFGLGTGDEFELKNKTYEIVQVR